MDLRSDGLHPSNFSQVRPQKCLRSVKLHPENDSHVAPDSHNDFPRLVTMRCDRINHCGGDSVDSHHSDDYGYDKPHKYLFGVRNLKLVAGKSAYPTIGALLSDNPNSNLKSTWWLFVVICIVNSHNSESSSLRK